MLQEERQNIILNLINLHHKVTTVNLCKQLKVSLDTVRRDLAELEKSGKIVKVHGGAISKSFQIPFQQPNVYAQESKIEIAKKALNLIKDGMHILCAGGTVMLELARMIPKESKCTFFTVGPLVALEMAQRSNARVVLLGGEVSKDSYICTGSSVISQLTELHVDLCFVGANSLSPKQGLTDPDWDVMQVKKALMAAADKTIVMTLSEKLNSVQRFNVCPINTINYLITELPPSDNRLSGYAKSVKIL